MPALIGGIIVMSMITLGPALIIMGYCYYNRDCIKRTGYFFATVVIVKPQNLYGTPES